MDVTAPSLAGSVGRAPVQALTEQQQPTNGTAGGQVAATQPTAVEEAIKPPAGEGLGQNLDTSV